MSMAEQLKNQANLDDRLLHVLFLYTRAMKYKTIEGLQSLTNVFFPLL